MLIYFQVLLSLKLYNFVLQVLVNTQGTFTVSFITITLYKKFLGQYFFFSFDSYIYMYSNCVLFYKCQ